jgi:hydroxymethylbilane synthase
MPLPQLPPIRIATRASALALWQAEHTADRLRAVSNGRSVELVRLTTHGDRDRTSALASMGGVGVFTREVQQAILENRADLAVHSLKDLPTETGPGLALGAILARAPRCDALILPGSQNCQSLDALPKNARIGSGSPRRRSQLLALRPDLQFAESRGNVDTRLKKLDNGEFDALILAEAGLRRLGFDSRISLLLAPPLMLPAVGQGAIGIECRADDEDTLSLLRQIDDPQTRCETTSERACLSALHAGCHAPVGVWSEIGPPGVITERSTLRLEAAVWSLDGRVRIGATFEGPASDPMSIGREVAAIMLRAGASRLIDVAPSSPINAPPSEA